MPITFDTLDELKEFCQHFSKLLEKAPASASSGNRIVPVSTASEVATQQEPEVRTYAKRGRKPYAEKAAVAVKAGKTRAAEGRMPAVKDTKKDSPRKNGQTLTAKIQMAIQNCLDNGSSFTANDIYEVLSKKNAGINKQSVITSVLKQMNTEYSRVSVSERPGNGPRPVKLYNA